MHNRSHSLRIPILTASWLNVRGRWHKHEKRRKAEKAAVAVAWSCAGCPTVRLPARVTFTRIAPRSLDVGDNLESTFKYMRDELASCFLLSNDAGPEVQWLSRQRKGGPREYAVEIEIEEV